MKDNNLSVPGLKNSNPFSFGSAGFLPRPTNLKKLENYN